MTRTNMKAIVLKDFLIALLIGFVCHLPILIIFNEPVLAKAVWLVSTNFFILNQRIFKLEQKIKKLESLLGWKVNE